MSGESAASWHILEASSVPAFEFASALHQFVPTVAWIPERSWFGFLRRGSKKDPPGVPSVPAIRFPLQRGYSRQPIERLLGIRDRIRDLLLRHSTDPTVSPLICTAPFFAPVAEVWPGPVVYYSLDFTCAYEGLHAPTVLRLEKRLCEVARLVCPVSQRIAQHLISQAGCSPAKIKVLPNATRTENTRSSPSELPDDLPPDVSDLQRPVAGIIGNMADNLNWKLIHEVIRRTPQISWLFVGPTSMKIPDRSENRMRAAVMAIGDRVRFIGPKPYGELQAYARSLDVAVLPYRTKEPTYSGSATRFYEHLATGRPILATRGVAELEEKQSLLRLVDGSADLVHELEELVRHAFRDGLATARWVESQNQTWECRAKSMIHALAEIRSVESSAGRTSVGNLADSLGKR